MSMQETLLLNFRAQNLLASFIGNKVHPVAVLISWNAYFIVGQLDISDILSNTSKFALKMTCETDPAGIQSLKSVPLYRFKLAFIVLNMAVKHFFETHFYKWRNLSFWS